MIWRTVRPCVSGARYNAGRSGRWGMGWRAVAQAVVQLPAVSLASALVETGKRETRTAPQTAASVRRRIRLIVQMEQDVHCARSRRVDGSGFGWGCRFTAWRSGGTTWTPQSGAPDTVPDYRRQSPRCGGIPDPPEHPGVNQRAPNVTGALRLPASTSCSAPALRRLRCRRWRPNRCRPHNPRPHPPDTGLRY
jgi:hypothetical protein